MTSLITIGSHPDYPDAQPRPARVTHGGPGEDLLIDFDAELDCPPDTPRIAISTITDGYRVVVHADENDPHLIFDVVPGVGARLLERNGELVEPSPHPEDGLTHVVGTKYEESMVLEAKGRNGCVNLGEIQLCPSRATHFYPLPRLRLEARSTRYSRNPPLWLEMTPKLARWLGRWLLRWANQKHPEPKGNG